MKRYNLILVLNKAETAVLMCHRTKKPYKGLYNLVGGKIDPGEDDLESAYRELLEETGISKGDILLHPLMDYKWHPINMEMMVYVGVLKDEITLVEEIHPLSWVDITSNFFDMTIYAGEGNIGHMVEIYNQIKHQIK